MTRCYDCLEQGVVGINMGVYDVLAIPSVSSRRIHLPHHHSCAARLGLSVNSKEVAE